MPIFGAIWYQGESNQGEPDAYVCAIKEMVNDWRAKWFDATGGQMNSEFPFGQCQVTIIYIQVMGTFPKFGFFPMTSSLTSCSVSGNYLFSN